MSLKKYFINNLEALPFDYLTSKDLIRFELFTSHGSLAYARNKGKSPKYTKEKGGQVLFHKDDVIQWVKDKYGKAQHDGNKS